MAVEPVVKPHEGSRRRKPTHTRRVIVDSDTEEEASSVSTRSAIENTPSSSQRKPEYTQRIVSTDSDSDEALPDVFLSQPSTSRTPIDKPKTERTRISPGAAAAHKRVIPPLEDEEHQSSESNGSARAVNVLSGLKDGFVFRLKNEKAIKQEEDEEESSPGKELLNNGVATDDSSMDEAIPEGTVIIQPEAAPDGEEDWFRSKEFKKDFHKERRERRDAQAQAQNASNDSVDSVFCTACTAQVNPFDKKSIFSHPVLSVVICKRCMDFYNSGPWKLDDEGIEEQCRWCGEGGNLTCCDACPRTFCKPCITRNLGRKEWSNISSQKEWLCYVCDASPLEELVSKCVFLLSKFDSNGRLIREKPEKERSSGNGKKKSGSVVVKKEQVSIKKEKSLMKQDAAIAEEFLQYLVGNVDNRAIFMRSLVRLKKEVPDMHKLQMNVALKHVADVKEVLAEYEGTIKRYLHGDFNKSDSALDGTDLEDFDSPERKVKQSPTRADRKDALQQKEAEKDAKPAKASAKESVAKRDGETDSSSSSKAQTVPSKDAVPSHICENGISAVNEDDDGNDSMDVDIPEQEEDVDKLEKGETKIGKEDDADCNAGQSKDQSAEEMDSCETEIAPPSHSLTTELSNSKDDTDTNERSKDSQKDDTQKEDFMKEGSPKKDTLKRDTQKEDLHKENLLQEDSPTKESEKEDAHGKQDVLSEFGVSPRKVKVTVNLGRFREREMIGKQPCPEEGKDDAEAKLMSMIDNSDLDSADESEGSDYNPRSSQSKGKTPSKGTSPKGKGKSKTTPSKASNDKSSNVKGSKVAKQFKQEPKSDHDSDREDPKPMRQGPGEDSSNMEEESGFDGIPGDSALEASQEESANGEEKKEGKQKTKKTVKDILDSSDGELDGLLDSDSTPKKRKTRRKNRKALRTRSTRDKKSSSTDSSDSESDDDKDLKRLENLTELTRKRKREDSQDDEKAGNSASSVEDAEGNYEKENQDENNDKGIKQDSIGSEQKQAKKQKREKKEKKSPEKNEIKSKEFLSSTESSSDEDDDEKCDDDDADDFGGLKWKFLNKSKKEKKDAAEDDDGDVAEQLLMGEIEDDNADDEDEDDDDEEMDGAGSKRSKKKAQKKVEEEEEEEEMDQNDDWNNGESRENGEEDGKGDGDDEDEGKDDDADKDKDEDYEEDEEEEEEEDEEEEDAGESDDDHGRKNKKKSHPLLRVNISGSSSEEEEEEDDKKKKKGKRGKNEKETKGKGKGKGRATRKPRRKVEYNTDDFTSSESDEVPSEAVKRKRVTRSQTASSTEDSAAEKPKKKAQKGRGKGPKRSTSSEADSSKESKKPAKGKKGKSSKRRRIKELKESDSDSKTQDDTQEEEGQENGAAGSGSDEDGSPKKGRKQIRRVMKKSKLHAETLAAEVEEKERRKRIEERRKQIIAEEDEKAEKSAVVKTCVLEKDKDTNEVVLEVDAEITKHLKPHQVDGITFMFDSTFESLEKADEKGGGCILAHCMGLGKTLQVITYLHTVMTCEKLNVHTCLVVAPLNTVLNWQDEFGKWIGHLDSGIEVYEMSTVKNNHARADLLAHWQKHGGVMIMGYSMYRNLALLTHVRKKKLKETFLKALVDPGPDVVVCDEGHMLKNEASAISKAMNKIKTLRRICLTGTPLQNNLIEYHCMVDFVKPSLLGTMREFKNRFVNPITNGQCSDSTARDVKIMKRRAHVLHNMLSGCVQRKDYSALTKFLPPKHEYVISVRLSPDQIALYELYLNTLSARKDDGSKTQTTGLFSDYQVLMNVWNHPGLLQLAAAREDRNAARRDMDDFITSEEEDADDDESIKEFVISSDSDLEDPWKSSSSKKEVKQEGGSSSSRSTRGTGSRRAASRVLAGGSFSDSDEESSSGSKDNGGGNSDSSVEVVRSWNTRSRVKTDGLAEGASTSAAEFFIPEVPKAKEWYSEHLGEDATTNIELSGKLILLFEILRMAESVGEKILVFSQSLLSLDLLEGVLAHLDDKAQEERANGEQDLENQIGGTGQWTKGEDYFRMDGSTPAHLRKRWSEIFNDKDNLRARLFLISTKAGSLGINLVGANRVVIFDANWNPSHDIQSIFRVYRFGQERAVFVYRFIAQGTMEEKIYDRQVAKQSLSQRVVDEHQIERHFTSADLSELYNFFPDKLDDPNRPERPTPVLPKDYFLAELLKNKMDWIVKYHEHDSLLENLEAEELTEEERKEAWNDYDAEKNGISRLAMVDPMEMQRIYQEGESILRMGEMMLNYPSQQGALAAHPSMQMLQGAGGNVQEMQRMLEMQRFYNVQLQQQQRQQQMAQQRQQLQQRYMMMQQAGQLPNSAAAAAAAAASGSGSGVTNSHLQQLQTIANIKKQQDMAQKRMQLQRMQQQRLQQQQQRLQQEQQQQQQGAGGSGQEQSTARLLNLLSQQASAAKK